MITQRRLVLLLSTRVLSHCIRRCMIFSSFYRLFYTPNFVKLKIFLGLACARQSSHLWCWPWLDFHQLCESYWSKRPLRLSWTTCYATKLTLWYFPSETNVIHIRIVFRFTPTAYLRATCRDSTQTCPRRRARRIRPRAPNRWAACPRRRACGWCRFRATETRRLCITVCTRGTASTSPATYCRWRRSSRCWTYRSWPPIVLSWTRSTWRKPWSNCSPSTISVSAYFWCFKFYIYEAGCSL